MRMYSTLHQLMSGEPRVALACAAFVLPGDSVLLVDSGVNLLGEQLVQWRRKLPPDCPVFALKTDALSRGLESRATQSEVSLIDDSDWVERVRASDRVLSWK